MTGSWDILFAGGDCDQLVANDISSIEYKVIGNIYENQNLLTT